MIKGIKYTLVCLMIVAIGFGALFLFSPSFKKDVQIKALDKIGDVAVKRLSENTDAKGSIAAEFINIPIEAREVYPNIWQATGVANTHVIKTDGKDVLFDTGLATQVPKQMAALNQAIPNLELSHIIVSHAHADHQGGVKFWNDDSIEVISHQEFQEEQRYLTELQSYFWSRNRTLFPFMPEKPPSFGLVAYGGVEPTQTVSVGQPMIFKQGGVLFEIHALSGAEGADNLVLWLPEEKILFSGDFFGPLFPQFPNVFTMRGEKIRKPIEYIESLDEIIRLDPDLIIPSHKDPITDKNMIRTGLVKMRDATRYVHDKTVEGMNAGKTVEDLMEEIKLPAALSLTQEHGKVSWAVKSIWEYYATWFHFDKTTELYAVPEETIYPHLVELAGLNALVELASDFNAQEKPLKALHVLEIVLESEPNNILALTAKADALNQLLEAAQTLGNSYEIYWLNYQIREAQSRLDTQ